MPPLPAVPGTLLFIATETGFSIVTGGDLYDRGRTMKSYFDVVIIAPLEEEFECILNQFTLEEDLSSSTEVRFRVSLRSTPLRILLVKQALMGRSASEKAFLSVCEDYEVGLAFCVGIAGGLSNDLGIGDVCFSRSIIDVIDNAKVQTKGAEGTDIAFSPTHYDASMELVVAFARNKLALNKSGFEEWQHNREVVSKNALPGEFVGRKGKKESLTKPKAIEGTIACGSVSADKKYNAKLRAIDRKVLAVETESGGFFAIAKHKGIPAITVRGISDYAEGDKAKFEEETNGKARNIAAENAITFLTYQLSTKLLLDFAETLRVKRDRADQPSLIDAPKKEPVTELVLEQSRSFDERLRELSPSYGLQAQGYHLPIPRVRVSKNSAGMAERDLGHPTEIRSIMRDNRVIIVSVPKEYPDYSLSWILANELLSTEVSGKQIVSAVVEGQHFRPHRVGVEQLVDRRLLAMATSDDVRLVVLIDDFDFSSKARSDFLADQVNSYPSVSFVITTRDRRNTVFETAFAGASAATFSCVDEVSFMEIAFFLQKQFSLSAPASEVVATRLRNTFSEFDLSAHPSYFAGIPKDTLQRLLDANRRGELIQLAVAGYLSFVVAGDDQELKLSRSTRETFLSELAFAINVNKKEFSEADLIGYVEQVKKKHDYAVSAFQFVQSFISKGILQIYDEKVRFTLPFIESYLLARRLWAYPADAARYFDLKSEPFDFACFALYSEMGASEQVKVSVANALAACISELELKDGEQHILLGNSLKPAMLNDVARLETINTRIRQFVSEVEGEKDNREAKQKLIDASEHVRRRANEESSPPKPDDEKDDAFETLAKASKVWHVAVSLLGAGVENLEACTKRSLIRQIIALTVLVLHHWTKKLSEVDFAEMHAQFINDREVLDALIKGKVATDEKEARKIAGGFADILEFEFLAQPFRTILGELCEYAREPVLAESLAKLVLDDSDLVRGPAALVHGVWLADVDVKRGKSALVASIKKLPKERFIRVALAAHLFVRVFWSHWKLKDRLELLDVANEAMLVTGTQYNKKQIEKTIKENSEAEV
jgi:nucleoside phosphorylase